MATAVVSEPPRPSVVMFMVSFENPWKPATIAMLPSAIEFSMRPGVTSTMRALPCTDVVSTPACEPVNDSAL